MRSVNSKTMWLMAAVLAAVSVSAVLQPPAEAGEAATYPIREVTLQLMFPDDPSGARLNLSMLVLDGATPADIAAGKAAMLARFPGAVEATPAEVAAQYRLDGVRWPRRSAIWQYNPSGATTLLRPEAAFAAIRAGATGWENAGGSGVHLDFGGFTASAPGCDGRPGVLPRDGANVVGWGHIAGGFWGYTCWWSAPGLVPGTAFGPLTEFDIVFEPAEAARYTPGVLHALALHEFGHALGLAHADPAVCPGVVMCEGSGATIAETPTGDDISGIVALYGVLPPAPVTSPPVFPPGTAVQRRWLGDVARE